MRRIFRFFWRASADLPPAPPPPWTPTAEQRRLMLELLSRIGLDIVAEARGPVPLVTFGRRVLDRLGPQQLRPLGPVTQLQFADGLKSLIRDMAHDELRVMSPSDFPGVGYIFNAADPETWPVRTSR
jgi:hypothetical protein